MAELLQIEEPARRAAPPPAWRAFLELGFRPLYLAGCAWAIVGVALWVFAPQWLVGALPGVLWHAHEMLWGFVATIATGFLLTAASNWTGVNPLHGRPLAGLCLLWLGARAGLLAPGAAAFWFAAACELGFFGFAAAALARVIYRQKSRRNYGIPLLLLGLGVADALYLIAAWRGDYTLLMLRMNTGLLCMAVLTLLIARRVIPFFAMRALPGLDLPMHTASGQWQLGAGVLAIVFSLLQPAHCHPLPADAGELMRLLARVPWSTVQALALAAAGGLALWQVLGWRPLAVRGRPILWVLYVGYAGLGAGLLVAAAQAAGFVLRSAWAVHLIGVGGFAVLIIGMATRTAMGHTGRPLQADRSMVASYALVIAAALLRLAALAPSMWVGALLHASASAWSLAFALYLWRFAPWLIRPRADQRGGTPVAVSLAPARPPAPR